MNDPLLEKKIAITAEEKKKSFLVYMLSQKESRQYKKTGKRKKL